MIEALALGRWLHPLHIAQHPADTPLENFRELLSAHKSYGSYS